MIAVFIQNHHWTTDDSL